MVSIQRKRQDAVFRAVADPTRRQILRILRGGRQTVGGIARNFRMTRPAISKHIHLLHRAGLIETQSEGTTTICSLNAKPLREVRDWVRDYEAFWGAALKNLKRHVEEQSES
jgi:DNA-binding transcriptional ArsR family regulator